MHHLSLLVFTMNLRNAVTLFFTMNFLRWMDLFLGTVFFTSHIYISIKRPYMSVITVSLWTFNFCWFYSESLACFTKYPDKENCSCLANWISHRTKFCQWLSCVCVSKFYNTLNLLFKFEYTIKITQSIKHTNKLSSFSLGLKKWANFYLSHRKLMGQSYRSSLTFLWTN